MKALVFITLFASTLLMWAESRAQTGAVGIGTTTPQAQLHTTASVRHDTLAGVGERPVLADAAGRLFARPNNFFANNTAVAIPDAGCSSGAGTASAITVSGLPNVPSSSIRVRLDIIHPDNGDLRIFLQGPTGQTLRLTSYLAGANFPNTVFSDAAATDISGITPLPYQGHFRPTGSSGTCGLQTSVSSFSGFGSAGILSPNGMWTLHVFDGDLSNVGTLLSWAISFGPSDSLVPLAVPITNIPRGGPAGFTAGTLYDVNGVVGIGTIAPHAPLQFANGFSNRKLVLQEGLDDNHHYYGFGINTSALRYQVSDIGASHVFCSANNDTTSNELMRISGAGNVGIGQPSPHAPLQTSNALVSRKIVLYEAANNDNQFYGFGVNTQTFRYQVPTNGDAHVFYSGFGPGYSNELFRISGLGKIGIGNSDPHGLLQFPTADGNRKIVLSEAVNNDYQFTGFGTTGSSLRYQVSNSAASHVFYAGYSAGSNELMRIDGNGSVKIGVSPGGTRAKLEIYGGSSALVPDYRYMNSVGEGSLANNVSSRSYSLYASERIWCAAEINVTSDVRTKTRIASSTGDLALVNRLRVVDYNYVDRVAKGDVRVKGFLAQEVERIMPEAVLKNTGVVPNIYRKAEAVNYNASLSTLSLTMNAAHGLKTGDTVKIITDGGDRLVPVVDVRDSLHFAVGDWKDFTDWAFVYGTQVHDLRNLDYNKIFSAGISAIQELSREMEDLKKTNAALQTSVVTLQAQMADVIKVVGTAETARR